MKPTTRRGTACLALAACLCLLAGCQTQLYGDLSEAEANAVMAALLEASISAEKRAGAEGAYGVFVDKEDFARAMLVLEAKALPAKRYADLGTVFGKETMFTTPTEEKARLLHAMQEEIARTLSSIDGVLEARVHLVLAEQDQLGRTLQTPSAAVFIKHVDDERHDPLTHRNDIRRLVAASVPNLDEERIVVTFFAVRPLSPSQVRPPAFREVLGLRLAPDSADAFAWLAAGAGVLLAGLGVVAALLWRRGRGDSTGR